MSLYTRTIVAMSAGTRSRGTFCSPDRRWHRCGQYQVLQEWVNVVTRRVPVPLTVDEAARVIQDFDSAGWRIISPQVDDVIEALAMMPRWQLSWWDSLIVIAAQVAGASVLWTEDLNHGQKFGSVTIQNPFHD